MRAIERGLRAPFAAPVIVGFLLVPHLAVAAARPQLPPQDMPSPAVQDVTGPQQDLRTFTLQKPPELIEEEQRTEPVREAAQLPNSRDRLQFTVGTGYVQAADWGSDVAIGGAVKGIQVQAAALFTRGAQGVMFDNGAASLFDPDLKWRAELGDVFSHLRGASRGARFSWAAAGSRRPAISLYGPRRGIANRSTVVSYRDQLNIGAQTLLDAEVTSDRSYLLRSHLVVRRLDLEAVHRIVRQPVHTRDVSLFAGYTLRNGITVNAGTFRSRQRDERNEWSTVSLGFPLTRHVSVTLERAFTQTRDTASASSAAMANINAGTFRFFHRHQFGEFEREDLGVSQSLDRQQTQSAASYRRGQRFDVTLQLATQRTESGLIQHWEELQTTAALTQSTTLRVATAVPDFSNTDRLRAMLRQDLPGRFAVQAEYGRLSAFQYAPYREDRPRFKLMLYKSWNVGTPTRGGVVQGRVVDHIGRPVAGARVQLGRYHVDTDATGQYVFRNVPGGDYQLSLVPAHLPADYAWDGRRVPLSLTPFHRVAADLVVAPLNSIHGRVYDDRNRNGRFDRGEGLGRAVIQISERLTSTDDNGAYSFFNLSPGPYVVRLNTEKLPADIDVVDDAERLIELGDTGPAIDVDFKVTPKTKPIIFQRPER